jgi:SWI/SNF-related matrix-associated actin-dependent regulator 1 of chromatin subfamily A
VDESHAFKTPTAQRTKAIKLIARGKRVRKKKDRDGYYEGGLRGLDPITGVEPDPIILNLTGTPVTIRPAEYVPQLEIIDRLDDFGGDMGFYRSFCDAKKNAQGDWDFSGASSLDLLNRQLRTTCYVRRERMDVLDLPPAMHADLVVPLEGKWEAEYRTAEADVVQYLVDRAMEIAAELGTDVRSAAVSARMRAEAGKHLVRVSVLRRLSALGKVEYAKEWVAERVAEGRKVIIAAHHRDVVDLLAAEFGGLKIQGGMTARQVEEVKAKFQTDPEAPVIVLSIEAGKEGHTLTAAEDVLFIEFPWTSTTYDQVWGRAHRKGQKRTVWVTALLGRGTRDIPHFDMLSGRRTTVRKATVGDLSDFTEQLVMDLLNQGLDAQKALAG